MAGSAAPGGDLAPGGAALHGGPRPRGLLPLLQPRAAGRLPPGPAPAHLQHPAAGVGGNNHNHNNNSNSMLHHNTILPRCPPAGPSPCCPPRPSSSAPWSTWSGPTGACPGWRWGTRKYLLQRGKYFILFIRTWWRVCGARSGGTAPPGSSWTRAPGWGTTPPPPRGGQSAVRPPVSYNLYFCH